MTDLTPQQIADAVAKTLQEIAAEFAKKRKPAKRPTRSARAALAHKPTRRASAKKKKANGGKRA
jgi:hypothetical protein